MAANILAKYGSQVNITTDSTNLTPAAFDKNFLFPIKVSQKSFKGGLFFYTNPTTVGSNTVYTFNSLVSTRNPTSLLFLNTLAS